MMWILAYSMDGGMSGVVGRRPAVRPVRHEIFHTDCSSFHWNDFVPKSTADW